jgi:hypothetical protein
MLINALSNHIRNSLTNRCILLRYEDFVQDPEAALARISALTDIDFHDIAIKLREGGALPIVGHVITGNRMRMQNGVRLKPDIKWHAGYSVAEKRWLALLAGPVGFGYGYRL